MMLNESDDQPFLAACKHVESDKKIPELVESKFRDIVGKFPNTEERVNVLNELDRYMEEHEDYEEEGFGEFVDEPGMCDFSSAFVAACVALVALYGLNIIDRTPVIDVKLSVNPDGQINFELRRGNIN